MALSKPLAVGGDRRARSEDAAARAALEEALELSRTLRLTMIEGVILGLLGRLVFDAGQHQQGRALLQRAESILRQVDSPRALARVTELLGTIALADGDVGGGRRLLEQSVSARGARLGTTGCLSAASPIWATLRRSRVTSPGRRRSSPRAPNSCRVSAIRSMAREPCWGSPS